MDASSAALVTGATGTTGRQVTAGLGSPYRAGHYGWSSARIEHDAGRERGPRPARL